MEAEKIAHIRELEVLVVKDIKNSNNILEIKKTFLDGNVHQKVRLAALHSLRRLFRQLFEEGKFKKISGGNSNNEKLEKFRLWLRQQYISVKNEMLATSRSDVLDLQVPSIRTVIEFACLEHEHLPPSPYMGVNTFHSLMQNLLNGGDIDIDVLLMLKDEIFSKQDCVYHALRCIYKVLSEVKVQIQSLGDRELSGDEKIPDNIQQCIQNGLDLMRLINISYPTESGDTSENIDVTTFLLPPNSIDSSENMSDDEDGIDDSDDSDDDVVKSALPKRKLKTSRKRTQLADEESRKKKKISQLSRTEKLLEKPCHLKEFSKTWLLLLSLPLTKQQCRVALKHLPEFVTPYLLQPIMLADYLMKTVCSDGGVIGILALESLFQLILSHNLDYPNFFEALYRMCNVEVLSAKYRSKFTTLLHKSLKSTNLPAYTVAAFVKRLCNLAIRVPGPSASFCLAQCVALLRNHPQCHKLIHNADEALSKDAYDGDVQDTDKCNAFSTSLYEATFLQQHYLPDIALLAKALEEDPDSTSGGVVHKKNSSFDIKMLISNNYQSMAEESLKGSKNSAPLAFIPPKQLFTDENIIGKCFGA